MEYADLVPSLRKGVSQWSKPDLAVRYAVLEALALFPANRGEFFNDHGLIVACGLTALGAPLVMAFDIDSPLRSWL